ncbi:hypothetical protein HaLaN_10978 [Haematococcus lacustris]|uniref:Uncharacterized protein n=1 Tax=Haematococcus lacustris TaxID=44745 RepID=A0A699ZGX3_HAELA|nr:hypothetical protein HaLaN_10978 [Haematococcus lacustris]
MGGHQQQDRADEAGAGPPFAPLQLLQALVLPALEPAAPGPQVAAGLAVMELLLGPCGLDERRSGPHTRLWEEAGAAADLAPVATECVLGLARLLQHAYKAPDYSSIDRLVKLMEGLVQSLVKAVDREDGSSMQPWVAMVAQQVLSGSLGLQPPVLFILLPLLDLGVVYKASG